MQRHSLDEVYVNQIPEENGTVRNTNLKKMKNELLKISGSEKYQDQVSPPTKNLLGLVNEPKAPKPKTEKEELENNKKNQVAKYKSDDINITQNGLSTHLEKHMGNTVLKHSHNKIYDYFVNKNITHVNLYREEKEAHRDN